MVRIGTTQPRSRLIDYRLRSPAEVLARVDETLAEFAQMVRHAGALGCDALAFPEDTLGLGLWMAGNSEALADLLPEAVSRMLARLGAAAAAGNLYLVCCNDTIDADGSVRNTAFLLGRDGREIGRYHKTNMPLHEQYKTPGGEFPVFATPELGNVGMLICYDMVFPETARCLALAGADVIFHPTLGGAAFGGGEISRAAFRTRAVENFVYLVVSQRGAGSMIVSARGDVLAEGGEPDDILVAEIDPFGGRDAGDSMNHQRDMRARLFRERRPAAFGLLTDPEPPALSRLPAVLPAAEVVRIANGALTVGAEAFRQADALHRDGHEEAARAAFERLCAAYPGTWIDRVSRERLAEPGS
jgi:predicted amidohydrolase